MSQIRRLYLLLVAVLLAGLVLAMADLLISTLSVLLVVFVGVLFGIFVNAISRAFERWLPLNYGWSFVLTFLLMVAVVAGGLYFLGAQIPQQMTALTDQLTRAGAQLVERLQQIELVKEYAPDLSELDGGKQILPEVARGLFWVMGGLTALAVVLIVGLYVAFDAKLYRRGLVKLFPLAHRDEAGAVLDTLHTALSKWIIGRLISMAIIGGARPLACGCSACRCP